MTNAKPHRPGPPSPPARVRGQVTLYAPELGIGVTGRYAQRPQVVAERSSSGAWRAVPRQQQRPITEWTGHQQVKVEAQIRFDRVAAGASVDTDIRALRRLQDRLPGKDVDRRPPYLIVVGYMPGHYHQDEDVTWVIDDLKIVEQDPALPDGRPMLALATVTLAERVSGEMQLRVEKTRTKASTYTWRKGDTLAKVARKKVGPGKGARDAMRKANPKIKKWTKVKKGDKVRIPASTTVNAA